MIRLNPYLNFNGSCREAMEFYKDCLGGKLNIMTVGETQAASRMPAEMNNRVMHSSLEKDGIVLMASDMMGDDKTVQGTSITLCINGTNKTQVKRYFKKLSEGGKVTQPLNEEFFGLYGALTDKYGFNWMFQAGNQ